VLTHRELVELLKTTRAAGNGKMLFTVFAQYHRMLDARDDLKTRPPCVAEAASVVTKAADEENLFVMLRAAYLEVKGVDFMDPKVMGR